MAYYFKNFPKVDYDLEKNNKSTLLTNVMVRFKVQEILTQQRAVYYTYNVKDNERADIIAFKYYGDATLDWLIYIVNNIIDPQYDWPLDSYSFNNYIIKKYGSVEAAVELVHHYERIVQQQQRLFDDTILPEKTAIIDYDSYLDLLPNDRKIIDSYAYELSLNEKKREIKLLDERYLSSVLTQVRRVFK